MNIPAKIKYLLLFAIFYNCELKAQKIPINFKTYSSKEGLSSGAVNDIVQDSFGFLWFATEDGVNRFDGTNFKVYKHDPAKPNGLRVNHISALFESADGCIWIGTNGGGLSYYDRRKDSIINFIGKGKSQIGVAITSINGDKDGNIWVTSYGGLFIINPKNKEVITDSRYNQVIKEFAGKVTHCFFQDSKRKIWVGTEEGLYLYEPALNRIKIFNNNKSDNANIENNNINEIAEDQNGTIWVATLNGLRMLLPGGIDLVNYPKLSPLHTISSRIVYTLQVDNKNRLWIGTEEGLDILDISTGTITNYIPDSRNPRSLSSRSVRSILIDKLGVYWVGTFRGGVNKYDENSNHFNLKDYNAFDNYGLRSPIVSSFGGYQQSVFIGTDGGGLQLYDRTTGLLDHITLPIKVKNTNHDLNILTLEMTRNNLLWIGTYMNGLYCYNPASGTHKHYAKGPGTNDLNNDDIFCLKEDRNGNIWIGTNGGGINLIKPGQERILKYQADPVKANDPNRPASNFIRSIEEDKDGRIWIGTFGSGISVFNPNTQKFSFYTKQNSGMPSDYVLTIKEDCQGNIWTGTSGNGIGLLKKGSKQFVSFTEKDGLANGTIHKIIEDNLQNIWVSTNNGLSCYDPLTLKFKNYSNNNGLQAGAFMLGAGLKLADGELFFGGQNGFNHFNPVNLKTNKNIPQVVFTELRVDNLLISPSEDGPIDRSMLLAEEIHLKYKQGFSIAFEATDFTVPEANQYEYVLKGFNENWIKAGKVHSAYYTNIAPGEYTFQVRASNNDGIWNMEGRSIKVLVAPPYWRTNVAYALYFLLFVALFLYLRNLGIKKIKTRFALEQERREAKQLIERERQEAEYLHKLDQMKIKFLTNLSHEFRTPISLIIGPVDNLLGQIKDAVPLNYLNLIKRNTKRLLNLVNQLLDFRKMEEQELKLQCNEGDIIFFIKDVCDSFNDVAQRKKIQFDFNSESNTLPVWFDHDKIERILFNILSNAFKFTTEKGYINVVVKELLDNPGQGYNTISVAITDTGIGIPEEAQPYIFDSFFQHDSTPATLKQGTGIGLSIAKEFVKMHSGSLSVYSKVGKGSTFTFQLKLKQAAYIGEPIIKTTIECVPEKVTTEFSKNVNGQESSVLIIEDDDDFRFYIKENLKFEYRIYEAPDGKEGWQRTLFNHPDIIVCDVQMPVMNGLELVQKLKSDKRTKHIPVILLTAADTANGTLDGLEAGAIAYLTKPFDFAILKAKIHNILTLNQSFKDTYTKQIKVVLPETEVVSDKDKFLKNTLNYIYENLDNSQLSVEVLSAHLCISRATLYNRMLEYTGLSPVDFIRSVKLEKAKGLLENSDMTITEVAYDTGFGNPNYFAKVFKAKFNMTPSEFHEEKKKKETI